MSIIVAALLLASSIHKYRVSGKVLGSDCIGCKERPYHSACMIKSKADALRDQLAKAQREARDVFVWYDYYVEECLELKSKKKQ